MPLGVITGASVPRSSPRSHVRGSLLCTTWHQLIAMYERKCWCLLLSLHAEVMCVVILTIITLGSMLHVAYVH